MTIVDKAYAFAFAAHAAMDQRRKYTGELYIEHPCRVVEIIKNHASIPYAYDYGVLAAAYLHDVVEDVPNIDIGTIDVLFGVTIGSIVWSLTDTEKGSRAVRKRAAADRLAKAPESAQTIKYADIEDNALSIIANDPKFAKVYMREVRYLLSVMTGGCPILRQRCLNIVSDYYK